MYSDNPSLDKELEDFMRWLAITPQHLKTYYSTPEVIIKTARLSPEASDWLRQMGVPYVTEEARRKLKEIVEAPENWQRSEFTRDRSIPGYGAKGVVKKASEQKTASGEQTTGRSVSGYGGKITKSGQEQQSSDDYGRDRSVAGYGGVIKKAQPKPSGSDDAGRDRPVRGYGGGVKKSEPDNREGAG